MKELFATGKSAKVAPALQERVLIILDALDVAEAVGDLTIPGFDFHTLRGKPQRYGAHVNGPWCITFEFDDGDAYRVDLEQYH